MSFVVLGMNHLSAPLETLEACVIAPEDHAKALHELSSRPNISEVALLSTCNRLEVYLIAERFHGAFQEVRDFLVETSDVAPDHLSDCLLTANDEAAIDHLFRVCAGIESAVVGEHEILGQVKRAWQLAQEYGCSATQLNPIFRAAVQAGKRVRTETGVGRGVGSVSQAAIALALRHLGSLEDSRALLVGVGEMGNGIAMTLAHMSLESITLISRTASSAQQLSEALVATATPFENLEQALVEADVVFTSTAATSPIVSQSQLERVVQARGLRKPLVIVDIGMPRDVDPGAANIEGVKLFDLDAVNDFVKTGLNTRKSEVDHALAVIADSVERYRQSVNERSIAPLISEFRDRVEQIRVREVARYTTGNRLIAEDQLELIESITRSIVAKVLHHPTAKLKESASSASAERLAAATRELFDLDIEAD